MKNLTKFAGIIVIIAVIGISTACKDDDNKNLRYSIQVNNQAAPRAISSADTVELYINNFEYNYDTLLSDRANGYGLILVADGDRIYPGGTLNNAGWYSVTADLGVVNGGYETGSYSSFSLHISKLKVNGTVYTFPDKYQREVCFGDPTLDWWKQKFDNDNDYIYLDNFSGINITNSTTALKTVLTVEPEILEDNGNGQFKLADKPYKYIKVVGILSN